MSCKKNWEFEKLGQRELLKGPAVYLIPAGIIIAVAIYRELTDCGCAD